MYHLTDPHKCMIDRESAAFDSAVRLNCKKVAYEKFGTLWVCPVHKRELLGAAVDLIEDDAILDAERQRDRLLREIECLRDELTPLEREVQIFRREAAAEVTRERYAGTVYYVRRDSYIKIGFTTNLPARLNALANGGTLCPEGMTIGPVELLLSHGGGRVVEQALHRNFAADRVAGEWFRPSSTLCAHIDRLVARRARRSAA